MPVISLGLSHHTAPIEIRECVWIQEAALPDTLKQLRNEYSILQEVAIISTCNRLEIYAVVDDLSHGYEALEDGLSCIQPLSTNNLQAYLYHYAEADAVEHLMAVAAGLDSMILGEPQILGQVTESFRIAQQAGTTGAILSHLFTQAIHTGKRARHETAISQHTTSISHAAVRLAQQHIGNLASADTTVIGAGEMARLAARALQMHKAKSITCINRTRSNAEAIARHVDGHIKDWAQLPEIYATTDMIIVATGAQQPIIHASDIEAVLDLRKGNLLAIIDIAVPRNVDTAVKQLSGVTVYDIDDLHSIIDYGFAQRQATIPQVKTIIQEELTRFMIWYDSRIVVPVIADLRRKVKAVAQHEVEQTLQQLDSLDAREQAIVNQLAHRIVNKILHEPTTRLKTQAASGNGQHHAQVVRELFALEDKITKTNDGNQ